MPAFNQNANTSTESTANEVHHQHPQNNNNCREAPEPGSPAMPEAVDNGFSNSQAKEGDIAGSMLGARGGPLFMPGLISPVTSAREFEASVTEQLTRLKAELCDSPTEAFDVSVEDLRIITDEELVDRAFKEVFKGSGQTGLSSGLPLENLKNREMHNHTNASEGPFPTEVSEQEIQADAAANGLPHDLLAGSSTHSLEIASTSAGSLNALSNQNKKKRGRHFDRETRAAELESDDILKAEFLAKIKRDQEEHKAMAQLHSLKAKEHEGTSKSEKIERLKALKFVTSKLKTKPVSVSENEPVRYPEVVLCIEFYHNIRKDHKTQEFLVLGRQPLTVLRDKIYCLTDQLMQKAEQHVPSGYFLIENVFYNDLRDPMAIDYSSPIIDWVRNKKDEALEKWKAITAAGFKKKQRALLQSSSQFDRLPFFRAVDMAATCFADLRFRLGIRYLYCHQGDCTHGIVIRDMRLIHPEDVQNKAAYPLLTFQPRVRHRKCTICDIYRAKKVTYDDKWAPTNPSFFCENCYYLLHYFEDGTLMEPAVPTSWTGADGRKYHTHDGLAPHSHEPIYSPGYFSRRARRLTNRDFKERAFTIGIGGPVGTGKTALMLALCQHLRDKYSIAAVTNDIFTKEDGEFLVNNSALPAERIRAVETGGCPHAAIREDISINLGPLEELSNLFKADILLCESGGDNLAANFSRELADYIIYIIDVSGGDKIPRKGGPGITQADLLVINKTDLAPAVGADLKVMERDALRMRDGGPFIFAQVKHGVGIQEIVDHVLQAWEEATQQKQR